MSEVIYTAIMAKDPRGSDLLGYVPDFEKERRRQLPGGDLAGSKPFPDRKQHLGLPGSDPFPPRPAGEKERQPEPVPRNPFATGARVVAAAEDSPDDGDTDVESLLTRARNHLDTFLDGSDDGDDETDQDGDGRLAQAGRLIARAIGHRRSGDAGGPARVGVRFQE